MSLLGLISRHKYNKRSTSEQLTQRLERYRALGILPKRQKCNNVGLATARASLTANQERFGGNAAKQELFSQNTTGKPSVYHD